MAIVRMPWVGPPQPRTIFVLGGGGNLGAVQVGMLEAVLGRGIVPDEVVACSAGAINGAAVAAEPTEDGVARLRELWIEAASRPIVPAGRFDAVRLLTHRSPSLQGNDPLRQLLESALGRRCFEELALPLHVVTTELDTGLERWFSAGPLVEPILASAALPGVFPPVTIDGTVLIDGGVVNNVPISKALQLDATRIVVFHVGNFDRPRPAPRHPIDVLLRSLAIARSFRFHNEIRQPAPEGVEIIVLPGVDPGRLRYNDFSRARELIVRGRTGTAAFLDDHPVAVGQA